MRGPLRRVQARLREFFLLEKLSRDIAARAIPQRQSIRAYYDSGLRRLKAAQVLRGSELAPASLSLYRQATFLLSIAFLISKDESIDPDALTLEATFSRLDAALAEEQRPAPPGLEFCRPYLVSNDPLALDKMGPDQLDDVTAKLEVATKSLAELVDPRSPRHLKIVSVLRIGATALLICALIIAVVLKLTEPKNIAFHRPATSSSTFLTTSPSQAVDGVKDGRFGFHSAEEDSPWWTVDLGKPFVLTRIKVYGRGDCCFEQSVPMALELSDDGTSFREVAKRTSLLSEADPWVVHPASNVGRFVRLRVLRKSYLVLSEVEVNGRKPN